MKNNFAILMVIMVAFAATAEEKNATLLQMTPVISKNLTEILPHNTAALFDTDGDNISEICQTNLTGQCDQWSITIDNPTITFTAFGTNGQSKVSARISFPGNDPIISVFLISNIKENLFQCDLVAVTKNHQVKKVIVAQKTLTVTN